MYRVLASLASACNDHFSALLLPAAITVDPARRLLVLPHYDGEDLANRWDETDGGALLGPGLAAAIPAILQDLARIDTACVTTDPVLSKIPGLIFDHDAALTRSAGIARQLTRAGLLTREHCAHAERLLAHHQHTTMIINNGDFYPRNLIVQPTGRIVIIDWETYNPHSPFHTVDHPENVAAVFYAHMWGNPGWQTAYRSALHQRFGFSTASFAKGVVIQALELANMWMNDTDLHLAAIQASTITKVLSQAPDS
jgi:aminoglycoside phosphotransferase (APT) family kinase protein